MNIIEIAIWHNKIKKERRKKAQKLNEVTDVCKKNKRKYHADLDIGIWINDIFFDIENLDKAMKFAKGELSLDLYK